VKKILTKEDHLMVTKEGRESLRKNIVPWYGESGKEMIAHKALDALDSAYIKIAELEAEISALKNKTSVKSNILTL